MYGAEIEENSLSTILNVLSANECDERISEGVSDPLDARLTFETEVRLTDTLNDDDVTSSRVSNDACMVPVVIERSSNETLESEDENRKGKIPASNRAVGILREATLTLPEVTLRMLYAETDEIWNETDERISEEEDVMREERDEGLR